MSRRRPASLLAPLLLLSGLAALTPASPALAAGPEIFVNEIHYDNDGTDAGELIEIAGPAGTDLTGWSVVLYNGSNGSVYDTDPLDGVLTDATGTGQGFVVLEYPSNGIQNGGPDGVALVDADGQVVQFLSYEGTLTAVGGPADGRTSTDIDVEETSSTPAGFSLQLTGEGTGYDDFTWSGPTEDTPGAANEGQTFLDGGGSGGNARPVAEAGGPYQVTEGGTVTLAGSGSDGDDDELSYAWTTDAPGAAFDDPTSATPTVDVGAVAPGSYTVTLTVDDGNGASDTDDAVLSVVPGCYQAPPGVTTISCIQGTGGASLIEGQSVTVDAVVTGLFEEDDVVTGFFFQEEDADADDDAATSEGTFVSCGAGCPEGTTVGAGATVTGTVTEAFGSTQVDASAGSIAVSATEALPTPVAVELPAAGGTDEEATFESVESMLVTFPGTLVVSEYFELARFGSLVLTVDERPYQFTHVSEPSVAGYQEFLDDLATRRIILDDNNNDSNDAIFGPAADEPYYYPEGGLSTGNLFRGGDTITDLAGVMDFSFGEWRVRPVVEAFDYTFEPVNPRPASPQDVGGDLTVASFNVLNYFTTIDETASRDAGPCGPSGTLDCRGADSLAELERQRAKIVAALAEIDADVVGLIEIQNDAGASTQDLVDALNAEPGAGTYAAIETGTIGTDAIKVAFIYQPASVTPVGDYAVLDSSVDPRFVDTKSRPVLIQTFEEVGTGERLTVAVNHLKSKGSDCDELGDPDVGDGQANCNVTRTLAAQALADYLATDPTGSGDPDVLIIGDLNSYRMEDPIEALEEAGYTDLLEEFQGEEAYSYVFDGQLGYLDYALANESLLNQVTGATEWHVNADEVPLFDYNDDVRDAGEASFERESGALPIYEPNPYRSSDHDPVVVGLDLGDGDAPVEERIAAYLDQVLEYRAEGRLHPGVAAQVRAGVDRVLRWYEAGEYEKVARELRRQQRTLEQNRHLVPDDEVWTYLVEEGTGILEAIIAEGQDD